MPKSSSPSSITVEEAVSRMVNLDYIPTGFTLIDMTGAFYETADVVYHNAKVDQLSKEELKVCELRLAICESRHVLATSLLDHLKLDLANPETSSLVISPDVSSNVRLELNSVSDWSTENYGISIPEWIDTSELIEAEVSKVQLTWKDITIKIYNDYRIGCFFGKGESTQSHFRNIGLMGVAKNSPNMLGGVLLGMSAGKKFPKFPKPSGGDKVALTKLRDALKILTGIVEDPFYPINECDGWKPQFTLIDDRRNADERAKNGSTKVSFDDVENYEPETRYYDAEPETDDFMDENDDASAWLSGKSNR